MSWPLSGAARSACRSPQRAGRQHAAARRWCGLAAYFYWSITSWSAWSMFHAYVIRYIPIIIAFHNLPSVILSFYVSTFLENMQRYALYTDTF